MLIADFGQMVRVRILGVFFALGFVHQSLVAETPFERDCRARVRALIQKPIETEHLVLTVATKADLNAAEAILRDHEVERFYGKFTAKEELEDWSFPAAEKGEGAYYVIREKSSNEVIGLFYFAVLDPKDIVSKETGESLSGEKFLVLRGTAIREAGRGKGYGTELGAKVTQILKNELRVDHIVARVKYENLRNMHILTEKQGYVRTEFTHTEIPDRAVYMFPAPDEVIAMRVRDQGGIRRYQNRAINFQSPDVFASLREADAVVNSQLDTSQVSDSARSNVLIKMITEKWKVSTPKSQALIAKWKELLGHAHIDQRSFYEYLLPIYISNEISPEKLNGLESETQEVIKALEFIRSNNIPQWSIEFSREYGVRAREHLYPSFDILVWDTGKPAIVRKIEVKRLNRDRVERPDDLRSVLRRSLRKLDGGDAQEHLHTVDGSGRHLKIQLQLNAHGLEARRAFFRSVRKKLHTIPALEGFSFIEFSDLDGKVLAEFESNSEPSTDRWILRGESDPVNEEAVNKLAHQFPIKDLSAEQQARVAAYVDLGSSSTTYPFVATENPQLFPSHDPHVFYFNKMTGNHLEVWKLDSRSGTETQVTRSDDPSILNAVLPEGLIVSRDHNGDEAYRIWLHNLKDNSEVALFSLQGVKANYQMLSPDNQFLYVSANGVDPSYHSLYRVNLETRNSEVLISKPGTWFARAQKDNLLLVAKQISYHDSAIYGLDLESRQLTVPGPIFSDRFRHAYRVAFAPDSSDIVVATNRFSDFSRLYRANKAGWQPLVDIQDGDIENFDFLKGVPIMVAQVNRGGALEVRAYHSKTFEPVKLPDLPNSVNMILEGSSERTSTVLVISDTSRKHYVIDWEKQTAKEILDTNRSGIDTSTFVKAELEYFTARDGTKIPAWVRRPRDWQTKDYPVLVEFHGGPEFQALPGFSGFAQMFVDAGFIYVEPNVRGSLGWGKKWLDSDNGKKRLEVVTDIEDIAKEIRSKWARNGIAPRLGTLGYSYGGYSALMGMTRFAGAYDAGVSVVGIGNMVTNLEHTSPYRLNMRMAEYGDLKKDRKALIALSPTTYADRIRGPLLLIQGAQDPRVPLSEAIQFNEVAEKKGIPVEIQLLADEGHGSSKRSNIILEWGNILEFFTRNLAPHVRH